MLGRTLNLGILAHVDAGKTTLTERLLYAAGVIDEVGSVDAGTTQTDSLALERQRGITIKSAVVSFAIGDVTVNLIDTPGHPDFIAEVERVLGVLDGSVLVLSAVEGVQPQTPLLMRALQRLRVPTLLFVNKVDRAGASTEGVLEAISQRLTPASVAMGTVERLGTRAARFRPSDESDAAFRTSLTEVLAERNESLLAAFVEDDGIAYPRLRAELAAQTGRALVHPVYFGSAITGAGVEPLIAGIRELLPARAGDADGPAAGAVFKIERGPSGEKIAYVRMFSGALRTRERLQVGDEQEKVTAISVFEGGGAVQAPSASAGQIARVWGLRSIRIGDRIGDGPGRTSLSHQFAPPTLEAVVVPQTEDDRPRLHVALEQLAEQDPLIQVRQDDVRREFSISLYGEVQKEVIQATLASDFGLDVTFRETTPIYIERPAGSGEAIEILQAETKTNVTGKSSPTSSNPFLATLGLRIEPSPVGSGIEFRLDVDVRLVPIFIYKGVDTFIDYLGQYVRETLQEGLFGWQVTDCIVTATHCGYRAPGTTAADFRKLTPMVVMQALDQASSVVCEPTVRASLDLPADAIGAVMPALGRLGGSVETPSVRGNLATIEAVLSAGREHELRRRLAGLTRGEGVLESSFEGYEPVTGDPPRRRRTTPNPLNRQEYLMHLARRV